MSSVVEYMHPDELARFRDMLLPLLVAEGAADLRAAVFGASANSAWRRGRLAVRVCDVQIGVGVLAVRQMEVISVKPAGEVWRVMLTGQIEGFA